MSATLQIIDVESATDAEQMAIFFRTIWTDGDEVVPFDLVLAAIHVGGYASIAKLDGSIVGASFGFLGDFAEQRILHSHVTAASVSGVGFELKQHQYAWAKEHELAGITWTFDPLVRRNCVFNFEKLGALAIEYLPNFYGTMSDSINAGDDSDRIFAFWPVKYSPVEESLQLEKVSTSAFALTNQAGVPATSSFDDSQAFWVELPEDIEKLRKTDLMLAQQWRRAVREVLQPALTRGWFVSAVNTDRTAILVRPQKLSQELTKN